MSFIEEKRQMSAFWSLAFTFSSYKSKTNLTTCQISLYLTIILFYRTPYFKNKKYKNKKYLFQIINTNVEEKQSSEALCRGRVYKVALRLPEHRW